MALPSVEGLTVTPSFPSADEIISHVSYAYITKDYGDDEEASNGFERNCLTRCCFPRKNEQWTPLCLPCCRTMHRKKLQRNWFSICEDKIIGKSPREFKYYSEEELTFNAERHRYIMNLRLSQIKHSAWLEIRSGVDFMGTSRFQPIMTTIGGMSIIQTLGVVVAFSDINEQFNEILLIDTVWLYATSIFFYVLLLIWAGCMSMADPLVRNFQPEQLQVKDLVYYFESTNFSYGVEWFFLLVYLGVSLAYFSFFYAVIRCTIAISQGQRGTNFLFAEKYRCYD